MMISVLRTFLHLLLATSLAVTPMSVALAAMDSTSAQTVQDAAAEPCHQSGHEQAAADTPKTAPMMAPCNCCDDDSSCTDDTSCNHKTTSPVNALPGASTASHAIAPRILTTALPCHYKSLISPPDSPPPLA